MIGKIRIARRFLALAVLAVSVFLQAPASADESTDCFKYPPPTFDYSGSGNFTVLGVKWDEADGDYNVPPALSSAAATHITNYNTYRDAVQSDDTLTVEQKAEKLQIRAEAIRCELFTERTKAYEKFYRRASVRYSCTKTARTWGTIKCPNVGNCIVNDDPNLRFIFWDTYRGIDVAWSDLIAHRGGNTIGSTGPVISPDFKRLCPPDLRKSSKGSIRDILAANLSFNEPYIAWRSKADADSVVNSFK